MTQVSEDYRDRLLKLLQERYDLDEFRNLCFLLEAKLQGLSYGNLPGETKRAKVQALIEFAERRDALAVLLEQIKADRPDLTRDIQELERPAKRARGRGESEMPGKSSAKTKGRIPVPISVARIGAAATIIAALIGLIAVVLDSGGSDDSNPPTPLPAFNYQVQVQDQETGEAIKGARVTIAVGGSIAPIDDVTDSAGLAVIPVDASRAGKLGRLIVKAPGYGEYVQYINLTMDTLPDVIQLAPAP